MSYQDINAATIDRWIKEEDWEWGKAISQGKLHLLVLFVMMR